MVASKQPPVTLYAHPLVRARFPPRDPKMLRAKPEQIAAQHSFAGSRKLLTPAEEAFAEEVACYLDDGRPEGSGWTCAELLDVLVMLGYVPIERNFEVSVHRYVLALAQLRRAKGGKRVNAAEALAAAEMLGWSKRLV